MFKFEFYAKFPYNEKFFCCAPKKLKIFLNNMLASLMFIIIFFTSACCLLCCPKHHHSSSTTSPSSSSSSLLLTTLSSAYTYSVYEDVTQNPLCLFTNIFSIQNNTVKIINSPNNSKFSGCLNVILSVLLIFLC